VKNNLLGDVAEPLGRSLSETSPGRIHDQRICDAEEPVFPADIGLFQDTGVQGYHPAGVDISQPKTKPTGKELTPEEKVENTRISSVRMLIAHSIAGVKRCRMVKEVFRNTKLSFADQVMAIACGVHHFRTTLRYNTLE
jgi:hypothetical protein